MPLLIWNDSLSVKIAEFDEEHKLLVKMINDLHDIVTYDSDFNTISKILLSLIQYAKTHFRHEEEFMREHGYAHLEQHIKEHQHFIAKVTMMWCVTTLNDSDDDKKFVEQMQDFYTRYQKGMNTAAVYVQDYVGSWIVHHVKKVDAHYGITLYNKKP